MQLGKDLVKNVCEIFAIFAKITVICFYKIRDRLIKYFIERRNDCSNPALPFLRSSV